MNMEKPSCRCPWVDLGKPDYVEYHDVEWGVPIHDDRRLFEFLVLESAQAGLSWYTVLRKRENYRAALDNFDPDKIALYDVLKIEALLQNPGIIRNRLKVLAAINNAQRFLEIQKEFGTFDDYIWSFVGGQPIVNEINVLEDSPVTGSESDVLSKDLRNRGFKFLGFTICYAHMQATGMVNDHTKTCFRRQQIIDGYASSSMDD
jgi:DNA-3-methyladenine glycosylase I